jgi:hypothetical protein
MAGRLKALGIAKELDVSIHAIRKWTLQGMPHEKFGKRLCRYELEKCIAWLKEQGKNK